MCHYFLTLIFLVGKGGGGAPPPPLLFLWPSMDNLEMKVLFKFYHMNCLVFILGFVDQFFYKDFTISHRCTVDSF